MQLNNHENKNKISQWNKQFKGKCYNCGEQGHQALECTKPKKKKNVRKSRRNIKYFICGENHYANKCPQKKLNPEQAYIFFGVTDIISENDIIRKIKVMIEINKLRLVITIIKKINSNQLFKPEGQKAINTQVLMTENKLLNNWLSKHSNIVENK